LKHNIFYKQNSFFSGIQPYGNELQAFTKTVNLKSLNIGMDRRIAQDKIIGFALGLGKQDRTATGSDFSGEVDTSKHPNAQPYGWRWG
jgi:hypothetical protein